MKIALICAFEAEIALLREHMEQPAEHVSGCVPVTTGTLFGHFVALYLCGIGKSNAAATTQLAVLEMKPDCIINIGLAGNCGSLPLGGALVANRLVYHDFRMDYAAEDPPHLTEYTPHPALRARALAVCGNLGIPCAEGTVATGDQFIADDAVRADIVRRTGCACVEMEGAAIAHMCHKNGVPYLTIKIISDHAGDGAQDTFHESLSIGGYCDISVSILTRLFEGISGGAVDILV